MRLQVLSDLHLEVCAFRAVAAQADVVVLAGDLHEGTRGLEWAAQALPGGAIVQGVRFIGATLWADLLLYGAEGKAALALGGLRAFSGGGPVAARPELRALPDVSRRCSVGDHPARCP